MASFPAKNRICDLRKQARLRQSDLAALIGVSTPTISIWENGGSISCLNIVEKLAAVFQVTPEYLMGADKSDAPLQSFATPAPALSRDPRARHLLHCEGCQNTRCYFHPSHSSQPS